MAKKKKKVKLMQGAASYHICVAGQKCPTEKTIKIKRADPAVRPGFSYTSPSAVPKRGAKEKRNYGCKPGQEPGVDCGCEEKIIVSKKTGNKRKDFTGRLLPLRNKESFCKSSPPCSSDRITCPVQAIWIKGKPHLRFCVEKNRPGWIIPATSVKTAQHEAAKYCKDWPFQEEFEWPENFFKENAPDLVEKAKKRFPESSFGPGLGQVPGSSSAAPLAIFTALGALVVALFRK